MVLNYPPLFRSTILLTLNAILLVLAISVWAPSYFHNNKNEHLIKDAMNNISKVRNELALRKALELKGDSASEILGKLDQSVKQTDVVVAINKIVARVDVTVMDESFYAPKEEDDVRQLKQNITIRGDYKNIRSFLSQIEDVLPGFNVIEKATIVRNQEKDTVDARIELNTYSVK